MVGWHHRLDGHESEQALGVGDGQGSLACFSPWGCKELDMTEWLNWTECEAKSTCIEYLLNLNVLSKLWKHRQSKFWCFVFLKPFQRKTEFLEIWLSLLAPSEPVGCSYLTSYSLFLSLSLTNTHTSSYRRKYIHIVCNPSVLLYSYEQFGLWNTALSDNMKHPEADSR